MGTIQVLQLHATSKLMAGTQVIPFFNLILTCLCLLVSPAFSIDGGDHLLIIGGFVYYNNENYQVLSDIELLTFDENDDNCKVPDLENAVYYHASVASLRGVITCGGVDINDYELSKCVIQYNGKTSFFPSMVGKRDAFGMLNVNETLF